MTDALIPALAEALCFNRRRVEHALKVYAYARAIGLSEKLSGRQMKVLECAAILHDVGICAAEKRYGSSAGQYQEELGPSIAREILSRFSLEEISDEVAFLIGHHHSYQTDGGILLQVLFEADFLVNLSEDETVRKSIRNVREKIFKTPLGSRFCDILFKEELA